MLLPLLPLLPLLGLGAGVGVGVGASPVADPEPEPFAIPLHLTSDQPISTRALPESHAIPLTLSPAYITRAIDAHRAKRAQPGLGPGLDPSWLLREEAKIDQRYNDGLGDFGSMIALPLPPAERALERERRRGERRERAKGKRQGEVQLANHNLDASYSGRVSIGTPAQGFDVVLDTGSADLWVAASECSTCNGMARFDERASSSLVARNDSFGIQYGSGTAAGHLVQDTVTMGGYSVAGQTFAVCNQLSAGLITDSLSGIMGLSWRALAYSRAIPWWSNLVNSGAWSQPVFAFYLARYRDVASASKVERDGGRATFGYLDSSLYSGSVTYMDVPDGSQYWRIPMSSVTMQGTNVALSAGGDVAVDTGTTLIGGPSDTVQAIYNAIPGARRMTGSYRNYYEYPCTTNIDFRLGFGSFTIRITDRDFNLGRYGSDNAYCTGAVFVQSLPAGSPVQWIVGDTALKNVYTVFRASPPAVGFASLAGDAQGSGGAQPTAIPSGSLTVNTGVVSAASSTSSGGSSSSASGSSTASGSQSSGASRSGSASGSATSAPTRSGSVSVSGSGSVSADVDAGVITSTAVITAGDASAGANAAASPSASRQSGAGLRVDGTCGAGVAVAVLLGVLTSVMML